LEENENQGVIYHRSGITGDYDVFSEITQLSDFIKTGKQL